jgi:hypothetical protein
MSVANVGMIPKTPSLIRRGSKPTESVQHPFPRMIYPLGAMLAPSPLAASKGRTRTEPKTILT